MKPTLTAKETADRIGIRSDKTLRLWVQSGKLRPVKGTGGQGRALAFYTADVEALRRRRSGVADVDLLARIACAFMFKREVRRRLDDAATTDEDRKDLQRVHSTCGPWLNSGFLMLWQWRKERHEDLIATLTRDNDGFRLPRLADVSPNVRDWARRIGQDLTPAELDYLAAMFIVTEHPLARYEVGEIEALSSALQAVKKAKPDNFGSDAHWPRLTMEYMDASADGLRSLIEDGEDSAGQFHRATLAEVRQRDRDGQQEDRVPSSLLTAARKEKRQRDRQGRAKSSSAKVAEVLGIRRYQATRIWRGEKRRKGIAEKIGADEMLNLALMLGLDPVPRAWQGVYRYDGKKRFRFSWAAKQRAKGRRQAMPLDVPTADAWNTGAYLQKETDRMARAGKERSTHLPS